MGASDLAVADDLQDDGRQDEDTEEPRVHPQLQELLPDEEPETLHSSTLPCEPDRRERQHRQRVDAKCRQRRD